MKCEDCPHFSDSPKDVNGVCIGCPHGKGRSGPFTFAQKKEFEAVVRPVIKWLCENGHPHMKATITQSGVDLYEGVLGFGTLEYLVD